LGFGSRLAARLGSRFRRPAFAAYFLRRQYLVAVSGEVGEVGNRLVAAGIHVGAGAVLGLRVVLGLVTAAVLGLRLAATLAAVATATASAATAPTAAATALARAAFLVAARLARLGFLAVIVAVVLVSLMLMAVVSVATFGLELGNLFDVTARLVREAATAFLAF